MKAWIKTFFSRIGDFIIKLIAVKTIMALVATYIAIRNPSDYTATLAVLAWAICVGIRFAEKVKGLIKR